MLTLNLEFQEEYKRLDRLCKDYQAEFNGLYDSICYGHDAELRINGNIVFAEWNGEKIELFHYYDHGFRTAKASFLAELGLVLRSKIAIAPMAKATKRV